MRLPNTTLESVTSQGIEVSGFFRVGYVDRCSSQHAGQLREKKPTEHFLPVQKKSFRKKEKSRDGSRSSFSKQRF
jgi:hypothetical protein